MTAYIAKTYPEYHSFSACGVIVFYNLIPSCTFSRFWDKLYRYVPPATYHSKLFNASKVFSPMLFME